MAEGSGYTLEKVVQVWDDKLGSRVEFKPDGDGLGLFEIRSVDPEGKVESSITITKEQAILLFREALQELER